MKNFGYLRLTNWLSPLALSACLLWGCGSTGKTEEKVSALPTSSCYGSYTDKDSVFLTLTFVGTEVSGDLTYKLYEKDKSQGTLQGTVKGDTIHAMYQFRSEGKTSTREVAFLKQGSDLVEGFAPMDETGTRFLDKRDIDFAGTVLVGTECK